MNRRDFLIGAGCTCCASMLSAKAYAEDVAKFLDWQTPERFVRPEISTDEGGLWAQADNVERQLRRSPFRIKDAELQNYIQDIACRLGGDHCKDIRVYIIETPLFNASMAPNGMMQVWSGLLLRADNEAQLAAVLGHEIGHYLARHAVEGLRDMKSKTAFAQVLGAFGLAGAVGQLALVASAYGYNRDQERMADSIGVQLMAKAGYDPLEAALVWENLLLELKAKPGGDPTKSNLLFATHPPAEERREALNRFSGANPGGDKKEQEFNEKISPFRRQWLLSEIKRGQHEESIALLTRKIEKNSSSGDYLFSRAEVYRSRAGEADLDLALKDYLAAAATGNEPPETYRGLGMIYRSRNASAQANECFSKYLQLSPNSNDSMMIKSYMENPSS